MIAAALPGALALENTDADAAVHGGVMHLMSHNARAGSPWQLRDQVKFATEIHLLGYFERCDAACICIHP